MKKINWTDHFLNFVAVILGVFLAFQIGAWTDDKKENEERQEIILSFIEELEEDRINLGGYQVPLNEKQSEAISKLLGFIHVNQTDSIELYLPQVIELQNVHPVTTTYNSVLANGKLGLIKDFKVKKLLSAYYDGLAPESSKSGELQVDFFLQEILPWLMKNVNLMDTDASNLGGNIELSNRMIIYQSLIQNKTEKYRLLDESAEKLIETLKELN